MKQIYLCSFYHPPDHRSYPILELQTSLNKIVTQASNSFDIILLGDFSFPGIIGQMAKVKCVLILIMALSLTICVGLGK